MSPDSITQKPQRHEHPQREMAYQRQRRAELIAAAKARHAEALAALAAYDRARRVSMSRAVTVIERAA